MEDSQAKEELEFNLGPMLLQNSLTIMDSVIPLSFFIFFIEMLVRSHEVKHEGYEYQKGGRVLTVFSAPNYCD